jgi:hypothetical protein
MAPTKSGINGCVKLYIFVCDRRRRAMLVMVVVLSRSSNLLVVDGFEKVNDAENEECNGASKSN